MKPTLVRKESQEFLPVYKQAWVLSVSVVSQGNARKHGSYGKTASNEPLNGWQSVIPTN